MLENEKYRVYGIAPHLDCLHIFLGVRRVPNISARVGIIRSSQEPTSGGRMRRDKNSNASRSRSRTRKNRIKLLLVDDHPSVLSGIHTYLRSHENLMVVGKSLDGADAVEKAIGLRPDIVILDLSLPKLSGMEVIRRIRCEVPGSKVIAYTMHEGKEFAREALGAGAVGYVLKSSPLRTLARAIERVYAGKSSCDPKIAKVWPPDEGDNEDRETGAGTHKSPTCINHNLTKRESQILKLLVEGETIKQIAVSLCVSRNTVSNHVRHIYEKLGVNTRGAVVANAIRENLG